MNIYIEQYYDDVMSDMDKVQTDLDRKKKRTNRSIELISTLNENYEHGTAKRLVEGVGYPRMCIQCVRSAVDAFLRTEKKRRRYAYSDPDRYDLKPLSPCSEIAKYAVTYHCYVLTGDYDFAVFPVEGIIDVPEILKAYDDVTDSILTIPRRNVLNALHLTDLKMRYVAVLCGNDFYPNDHMKDTSDNENAAVCLEGFLDEEDTSASSSGESDEEDTSASSSGESDDEDTSARSSGESDDEDTSARSGDGSDDEDTPLCLKDVDYRDRVSVIVKHIATLPSTKADLLDDCMKQFPKLSRLEIEERFFKIMLKYNTKAYPLFPQSCLPQSIDDDVFTLCGVSEGNCVPFLPSQILSGS